MTTIDPAFAPAATARPRAWTIWTIVLATGLLVGFGSFVYQWSHGLGVTGLSNTITWGLYIVAFMFLVGISAGGLIVVAGAELVGSHRFEHLNRLAVVCSVAAVATAAGSNTQIRTTQSYREGRDHRESAAVALRNVTASSNSSQRGGPHGA